MEDHFELRIRRVTNGYIVDMGSPMAAFAARQAVFQTVAQIAEALPLLLNDPPVMKVEPAE